MKEIILPRKGEDGDYYISYSQYNSFKSAKSFNLGIDGKHEYIRSYFLNETHPDQGWAEFGQDVEDYICYGSLTKAKLKKMDKEREANKEKLISEVISGFSDDEKETLHKVKPLGNFQVEINLQILPNVFIKGFIDDANEDLTHIRDYKTCSKNSSKKYYGDEYYQLDIYSAWVEQETGKLPDRAEVCMIERKGNCFGMTERRDLLSVGNEIWYTDRDINKERVDFIIDDIRDVVFEISELYKVFLKTNK
jgi:hypothetical protein